MRTKKALQNTIAGFGYEIVALICGLILPRLILSVFGSKYNGLTASITQFLSCIALMKSGIGGVTRAALYKALAIEDYDEVSGILAATQAFLRKIAIIFLGFLIVFAFLYPILVKNEFGWLFSSLLILIIGISTFVEYYFGLTYELLLSADQRQCVISIIRIITTILNTILASVLILFGAGIHLVKLGSALAFALNPLIINAYARKKYNLISNIVPKTTLLNQRWDALGHEVANFVNSNTDIIILTLFSNILEVSVYTVYQAVINGIRKVVTIFVNGFGAAFGNMYAKKQFQLMEENFRIYELIIFSLTSIIYSTTAIMFTSYAELYTSGIYDVEYGRPLYACLVSIAGAFSCFRIPYQTIVTVAGHYKQTRNGAFFEAFINVSISAIFVINYGLIGVAIGTVIAAIFRTFQYALYMSNVVLKRSIWLYFKHIIISIIIFLLTYIFSIKYINFNSSSVLEWIVRAGSVTAISCFLTIITNCIFYRTDIKNFLNKSKKVFTNNEK